MSAFLDLLFNEGTSATVPARFAALAVGIVACGAVAAVWFAGRWVYRRLDNG